MKIVAILSAASVVIAPAMAAAAGQGQGAGNQINQSITSFYDAQVTLPPGVPSV